MDPLVGQVLDQRYVIEATLGRGGMGVVYSARHVHLGEPVAVKALLPERARDPIAARRFAREARSAFRLDHEHIVRVTDFGATGDGLLYMVMELAPGRTLGEVLDSEGPLAPRRAMAIAAQIASALAHAHRRGIVHRDLKIDNVMVADRDGERDFVKVLDFGLAKVIDTDAKLGGTMLSMSPLTAQGTTFGTPEYMSPEQATGSALDGKSDVYSLGVCLYELLTGALPFTAEPATAVLAMHVAEPPPPLAQKRPDLAIPEAASQLVLSCLAKKPENRPAAADLMARCETLARTLPTTKRISPEIASSATVDLTDDADLATRRAAFSAPTHAIPIRPRGRFILWALPVIFAAAVALVLFVTSSHPTPRLDPSRKSVAESDPVSEPDPESESESEPASESESESEPGSENHRSTQTERSRTFKTGDGTSPRMEPATRRDDGSEREEPHREAIRLRTRGNPEGSRIRSPDPPGTAPSRNEIAHKVRTHLAAAEAARRAHNRLQQLAEADAALRLAPRSRRAAFLVGDALIASGDVARGCRYLSRALPDKRARKLHRTRCGN